VEYFLNAVLFNGVKTKAVSAMKVHGGVEVR